jgi:hypothetical protein
MGHRAGCPDPGPDRSGLRRGDQERWAPTLPTRQPPPLVKPSTTGGGETLEPFDTAKPNIARVWDYWLGGKDNISQVVPAIPYSARTLVIQALQACYSKTKAFAVRTLSGSSLSAYVRFIGRGFLTLA